MSLAERLGHPGPLQRGPRSAGDNAILASVAALTNKACGERSSWRTTTRSPPSVLRPSVEHALILACTGELDTSYDRMRAIQQRCTDKGEEGDLIFVDFYVVVNRIWRGDLVAAKRLADDVTEMARQLGAEFPTMLSLVLRAWLAVYDGAEADARLAVADAIDASQTQWHRVARGLGADCAGAVWRYRSAITPPRWTRCRAFVVALGMRRTPPRYPRRRSCPTRWRR